MLPKIVLPIHDILVPSLGKKEKFRPYTVREEKLFLMAKTSGSRSDMIRAIKQVVNLCALREGFDVDDLTVLDVEWLFLQLRAISVDGVITVRYLDPEDQQTYPFDIQISDIKVKRPETTIDSRVRVTDTVGVELRYPPAGVYGDERLSELDEENAVYEVLKSCVKSVWDGETVYDRSSMTDADIEEFIDGLDMRSLLKMREYLDSAPRLEYVVAYKNSLGRDRRVTLNTLADFFDLG